ncbi:hypothetical protein M9Y10_011862 [Tritrichomonas musculus]|uniref:Uncharacterized protein n=1 Tax=Tritrichomonas musculus TaxID=1915356 RepID=A0ABR2IB28_9EUKA
METIKEILNLFFTAWTPEIRFKYTSLCDKLSLEDKKQHLDSINLLAILIKVQGIEMIAFNSLYKKYNMINDDFLNQLPSEVLLRFWESLPQYICIHPQIALSLNNLVPVLEFDDSYKIFPHIIALSNPYLLNEFITRQSNKMVLKSLGYLFSSDNTDLICQIYPFFLKKEPNLISYCIQPDLKEEILTTALISNMTGKISSLNLAYLLMFLKNGKIKQDSKLFKAFGFYIKKFFIPDLNLNTITSASLFDTLTQKYPELVNEKPFTDHVIQTIEEAKLIVEDHRVNKIESFANDLISNGNNEEFNKYIAAAAISGLISSYIVDKNLLIKLILLIKQLQIVEFPDFLTVRLLRKDPNQIEKISSFHAIPAIASSFINGKLNPKVAELCSSKPYQIVKALYLIAVYDQERKKNYPFPSDFQSFINTVDFKNMKIPKGAPDFIKTFKFNGNADSLQTFYTNAFNDKNLTYKYFDIDKNYISRLVKIAKKYYPEFSYENKKDFSNFPQNVEEVEINENLFVTRVEMDLPEESFNSCLMSSLYNPDFTNTLNTINNDDDLEEYANLFMSTIGK